MNGSNEQHFTKIFEGGFLRQPTQQLELRQQQLFQSQQLSSEQQRQHQPSGSGASLCPTDECGQRAMRAAAQADTKPTQKKKPLAHGVGSRGVQSGPGVGQSQKKKKRSPRRAAGRNAQGRNAHAMGPGEGQTDK